MIIGFGTRPQEAALLTAGAERVFIYPSDLGAVMELAGISVRPNDILLMVQPSLLKVGEFDLLHKACGGQLLFQVVGHEPFALKSNKHFAEFRKTKPKGLDSAVIEESTGRPRTVATYSLEQANAVINLWHRVPKYGHDEIVEKTREILKLPDDAELKSTWVRDLVGKYVGTAQRDKPNDWTGIGNA